MPTQLPRINVTLPKETHKVIQRISRQERLSMSEVIVLLTESALRLKGLIPEKEKGLLE